MEVTQSASKCSNYPHAKPLLRLARESIGHGLSSGKPVPVALESFHEDLRQPGAAFVTLHKHGELRGCIGNLTARQALARDVADNAFAAAFRDQRFSPLSDDEFEAIHIHISVLTPQERLLVNSEEELLEIIEPELDGISLEEGYFRSTFLPAVWEQLPDKSDFLKHLKLKAGLPLDYWSESIEFYRYRTLSIEE